MLTHLRNIQGVHEYKDEKGEMSLIEVSAVGLGYRTVRVACLPPQVKDTTLSTAMTQYGEVHAITEEQCSQHYRYKVSNEVAWYK
jgi:hypothetical protein